MQNIRKIVRLDAATWPFGLSLWWALRIIDILAIGLIGFGILNSMTFMMPVTAGMIAGVPMSPFYVNRKGGTEGLLATMPFQRKEVVIGHLLYGYGSCLMFILNFIVIFGIDAFFFNGPSAVFGMWIGFGLLVFMLILLSVQYPLVFALDLQQTLIIIWVPLVGLGILSMYAIPVVGTAMMISGGWITSLSIGVEVLVMILIVSISGWLSVKFYEKKEF